MLVLRWSMLHRQAQTGKQLQDQRRRVLGPGSGSAELPACTDDLPARSAPVGTQTLLSRT